ncbi:MAG: agmatinase [bacterium]|nr:agmatinase [bacterium]
MNNNRTYAGIPSEKATLDKSQIVLITIPYDATSTWGKGADKGPEAFLDASENMELYDIETKTEVYRQGVFLSQLSADYETPDEMVTDVHYIVKNFIHKNKFVTIFGGEHSISIGTIRAFNECFDNLTVLQIDAHADLRAEYDGSPYNHACAMHEANETTNLVQVGIRSMDESERKYINAENVFFAHQMVEDEYWADKALECMTENVFITFDLDGFDPSVLPATGTPEPGGLHWYETLAFLKKVFETKNVVGFDIVELCPGENDNVSSFAAAKLYYKMLSYKFQDKWI